jgi:hypothetical protein
MEIKTDDTPTIDGLARRSALLARGLLTWDDSRAALRRGIKLLTKWEKAQAKLPNQHDTE